MLAITREVPRSIERCEVTHVSRTPIDLARARAQHEEYEQALRSCGCQVVRLGELPDHPDSVFVEDVAIVLDDVAVLTRPGAVSRQGEVAHMAPALSRHRPTMFLREPATLDGGDALRLDRTVWVGRSSRTNEAGVAQLRELLSPLGYQVRAAAMHDALHLKSAVTPVGARLLLANPAWADPSAFGDYEVIEVDPREPFAANAVLVNDRVIHSSAFPWTQDRLRARGVDVVAVDASELAKAEGGVTCCALLFEEQASF